MVTSTHESSAMHHKANFERTNLNIAANQWASENLESIKRIREIAKEGYYVNEDGNRIE